MGINIDFFLPETEGRPWLRTRLGILMCSLLNGYSRPSNVAQRFLHKTSHQRIAQDPRYIEYQKVHERESFGRWSAYGNPNIGRRKRLFKNTPRRRV